MTREGRSVSGAVPGAGLGAKMERSNSCRVTGSASFDSFRNVKVVTNEE